MRAEAAGLDTPEGLKLLEVADRQSQRAERVLVTVHDLARVHAESAPRAAHDPLARWMPPASAVAPAPSAEPSAVTARSDPPTGEGRP